MVVKKHTPSRNVCLFVRYVSLLLVATWLVVTYILYTRYDRSRIVHVCVDFANSNAYNPTNSIGTIELLVQGSNSIQSGVDYSLFIHVIFLDSWTTVMSGVLTFLSDFGHGRQTISSFLPIARPPFSWAAKRFMLFPLYASGMFQDTVEHTILVSTSFLKDNQVLNIPIHPVNMIHIKYVARVQIIPSLRGHVPDIVSISAWFQASREPQTWSGTCMSYGLLLWYICMTLSTVLSLTTCFMYSSTMILIRFVYPLD
jgi:hypothetical protein